MSRAGAMRVKEKHVKVRCLACGREQENRRWQNTDGFLSPCRYCGYGAAEYAKDGNDPTGPPPPLNEDGIVDFDLGRPAREAYRRRRGAYLRSRGF